ncbi:uncharacterized protein LOC143289416 isoform X40 [Babylonia areolata]|uniref:uncharacterized protein LOC143289416 isoform X40 n=1 Tax=Babylonia areolata TaxID=304850 RepID=UPI003FD146D8
MADKQQRKSDGNAGFLRAARDGNLQEVLEYLKGSTDINTSNPNGLNALHLASKEGHVNIVTELLQRGANVEAATKKGNTALHIASLAGHEEIVKILVDTGAHVNLQAQAGFTPLYMAAQEGHAEVVRFLLTNGANQSLATEDGFTPLAVALQQGHDRVVSVLLEHDTKGKVRLPALHIAAKKDDVKSAALLLQNEQNNVDLQTKSGGLVNDTTKSGFTPLHIASHYGNTNVSTLLIQRGADVNFKAKNNITPLHVASRWGKSNMVQLLLDHKAVIDEKTRDGLTPLHCASRSGHEAVVDLLLEKEAPHSSKTKNGLTPLHMSAQGDHVDCARLLLYHKANVNEVTVDYLTPLHVAAHCGNVKTAKLLLDRKCEPNARALNGFTPLHIACKKNRIKVVELLLKYGASIDATTESGLTPLHVASFMGHMNIVIYLIQHNANPDTPTVRGETSLHLAARANQTDIIRILLRNGATVDARAREQQTPLHIASRLGNVDNVVFMLQMGADADATTKDKYTPLHIAAKEGHDEVAQVLLEHGASHDVTTKKGFTPLHIAAKYGNIKVARLLLQKDANPDVQGKNGLTPLHVATHYNHVNVAQLLLENKADPHATAKNGYTPLHIAAKKDQMEIATTLLEYGANPNCESKNGFTPLHLASQEGHTDIVSLLLEKDANVNAKAHNGLTPMHLAAQEDKVPVAEILAKYRSEIDSQTKAGYTPLHTACHFGQINMVRFLLDQGASVSATTKMGYTPLHQAAQQGHVHVVNLLLKNGASPNTIANNGQTPLAIAQKLGYISVVDILKPVTEVQDTMPTSEDKYKVVSPETMQETFISDSEDEGGTQGSFQRSRSDNVFSSWRHPHPELQADDFLPQSPLFGKPLSEQHVYLPYYEGAKMQMHTKTSSSLMPSKREDSISLERGGSTSPMDTSFDKDYMEAQIVSQSFTQSYSAAPPRVDGRAPGSGDPQRFSSYSGSSFSTTFDPDNVPVDRSPVYSGFLISFMVDARGGAMRGCRHSGVRIIIPPKKCSMPTRVTCRLIKREKLMKPPPMAEGEGLAARILEMGPVGTQFLGPIVIEVPHFASLRGKEREVVVMRSDNGESWYEHPLAASEEAVSDALGSSLEGLDAEGNVVPGSTSMSSLWKLESEENLQEKRVTRILTTDFPQYFALVSRIKQETAEIGYEGGVLSSTVVPQVQAVLPEGTLTKPIRVGLQAQPIAPELVAKLLGNRVAVSPIVTVEPRHRRFHKPITLTIPVPKAAQKGMINQYNADRPTLRLLFSLAGKTHSSNRADPNPTKWDDITKSKPITLVNDCVSFTTTVSARFWLIDCQNIPEVVHMASALYREAIMVPYMAKFVVFGKRTSVEEGRLRMFCMTDDKVDKTLEKQEKFVEIARSRDIEVLEGRPQYIEMAGNLIPVTKSGDQLHINFKAFRENRLPSTVKIRDPDQEAAARVAFMKEPKLARGEAPQTPICNLNIRLPDTISASSSDVSSDTALEMQKRHSLLREQGIVVQDTVSRSSMNLSDVADNVQGDWVILAQQLGITMSEINRIKTEYTTLADQALAMLQLWVQKNQEKATGNALENALQRINREDVVKKCMYNTEVVDDEVEAAAARVAMDQSGFDTFKEEVGITKDSMKRGLSLDVQYDEQDIIKESESAEEESIPGSERGSIDQGPAPQAMAEVSTSRPDSIAEEVFSSEVDHRRPVAKVVTPVESEESAQRKKQAFINLAQEMDLFLEGQEQSRRGDTEERDTEVVKEEEIMRSAKTSPEESKVPLPQEAETTVQPSQKEPSWGETPAQEVYPTQDTGDEPEDEEVVRTPPPSPTEKFKQEEAAESTPSFAAEAATRLASETDTGDQVSAPADIYGSDVDGKIHPTETDAFFRQPAKQDGTVTMSDQVQSPQESDKLSDQVQSPQSEGSFKEEPSPVPEPAMPDDFVEDDREIGDVAGEGFELEAELGQETFIDRHEETVPVSSPIKLTGQRPSTQDQFGFPPGDFTLTGTPLVGQRLDTEGQRPDSAGQRLDAEEQFGVPPGDFTTAVGVPSVDGTEQPARIGHEEDQDQAMPGAEPEEECSLQICPTRNVTVFDSAVSAGETVYEETSPDGKTVTYRRTQPSAGGPGAVRVVEGPERETTEVQEKSEILPDGTYHSTQVVTHQKVKHVLRSIPSQTGDEEVIEEEDVKTPKKQEIIEMFDQPPKLVQDSEEIEQVLEDGTKVKRQVVMNRMVHMIKMRHESFDEEGHKVEENYEIEEVIPGTESAFVAGVDSDYEEEQEKKRTASLGEAEAVMHADTMIKPGVPASETTTTVRSPSEEATDRAVVTEERVSSTSLDRVSSQPVSYVQEGRVGDTSGELEDIEEEASRPTVQPTVVSGDLEESESHGVVETSAGVLEDMINKGQLPLQDTAVRDEGEAASAEIRELEDTGLMKRQVKKVTFTADDLMTPSAVAPVSTHAPDSDRPTITITEDLSTPPDEDEDVPSYFGVKYEASSEVIHEMSGEDIGEEDQQGKEAASPTTTEVAEPQLTFEPSQAEVVEKEAIVSVAEDQKQREAKKPEQVPSDLDDIRQPVSEHVTQVVHRTTYEDEYRRTDIEITEKETVLTERLVHKEEYTVASQEAQPEEEIIAAAPVKTTHVERYEMIEEVKKIDSVEKEIEPSSAELSTAAVCVVPAEEDVEETIESTQVPETKAGVCLVPEDEEEAEEPIKPEEATPASQAEVGLIPDEEETEEATAEISAAHVVEKPETYLVAEDEDIVKETVDISQAPLSEAGVSLAPEEGELEIETVEISEVPVSEAGVCLVPEKEAEEERVEISEAPVTKTGVCLVPEEEVEEETVEFSQAPQSEAGVCHVPEEEEIKEEAVEISQVPPSEVGVCLVPEEEVEEETVDISQAPESEAGVCIVPEEEVEEETVEISQAPMSKAGVCHVPEEEEIKEEAVEISQVPPSEAGVCLVPEEEVEEETVEISQAPMSKAGVCHVPEEEEIKEEAVEISQVPSSEAGVCLVPEEEVEEETVEVSHAPMSEAGVCHVPEEEEIKEEAVEISQVPSSEAGVCLVPEEQVEEETVEVSHAPMSEAGVCHVPEEEEIKEEAVEISQVPSSEAGVCLVPEEQVEEETVEISQAPVSEAGVCLVPEEEEIKEETVEISHTPPSEAGVYLVPDEVVEEHVDISHAPPSEAEVCLVPEEEEIKEETTQMSHAPESETGTCLVPEEEEIKETVEISQAPLSKAGVCLLPDDKEIVVDISEAPEAEVGTGLVPEEEVTKETVHISEPPQYKAGVCLLSEEEEMGEKAIEVSQVSFSETGTYLVSEAEQTVEETLDISPVPLSKAGTCAVPEDEEVEEEDLQLQQTSVQETASCLVTGEEVQEEIVETKEAPAVPKPDVCVWPVTQLAESADTAQYQIRQDIESEEEEDEDWEILEKEDLTEEEQIAAMDETLMQVSETGDQQDQTDDKSRQYDQAEARYDAEISYQSELEATLPATEEMKQTEAGATHLAEESLVTTKVSVKEVLEKREQLSPTTELSQDIEGKKEETLESEQTVREDQEVEEAAETLAASKPSEASLDLSEVVDIVDDTDKTYKDRIDEVIISEAREEMEGEALEVSVKTQSPDSDKDICELDSRFDEPYSQVQPEIIHEIQFKGEEMYEQIDTVERESVQEIPDKTEKGEIQTVDQTQVKVQSFLEAVEGVAAEQDLISSPGSRVSDISPVHEEQVEAVPVTQYAESSQQESYFRGGEPDISGLATEQESYEQMSYAEYRIETVTETTTEELKQEHVLEQEPAVQPQEETEEKPAVPPQEPELPSDIQAEQVKEDRYERMEMYSYEEVVTKKETIITDTYVEDDHVETLQQTDQLIAAMPDVPLKSPHISSDEDEDAGEGGQAGQEDIRKASTEQQIQRQQLAFEQQKLALELAEVEPSPVEESPPDVAELDQEIEEQDALTAALMSQYQVTKEEKVTHYEAPEEAEYAVPDFREGESDYESEEEDEVASDDKDEEDAAYKTPEDETAEKEAEEELAEKQTEERFEDASQFEPEQDQPQTEIFIDTYIKEVEVMTQSTESPEVQIAGSGEGLLVQPYPQEYDIMAISGGTEGDQEQEPDYTDMFEVAAEEVSDHDDLYERYSDVSEEELKPLKIPVEDSPTEQPTPSDFFQEAFEEAERPDIEAEDYRQSPGYDRSPEEEVYRSPTEEHPEDRPFDSPLQEELVEEKIVPQPEQYEVKSVVEQTVEQTAVSGILAELQEIEQHAGQDQSEDEMEDDLEQYEKEPEEEPFARADQTVQSLSPATVEQFVDRQELFVTEQREVSMPRETTVEQEEVVQSVDRQELFTTEQRDVSVPRETTVEQEEVEQSVDRQELFTTEQRDVSVPRETTVEEEEVEQSVDRQELFTTEQRYVSVPRETTVEQEEVEQSVDRQELFTTEQRDVSVPRETTVEEEEVEQSVDRQELFTTEQRDVSVPRETTVEEEEIEQSVDRQELFTTEQRDVSVPRETTVEEEEVEQSVDRQELFTTEQRDVSVPRETTVEQEEVEQSVDRQELFTTEQREVSIPRETADQEEEEEELVANVFIDRTERFIEEPIETLTVGGDSTLGGFVAETTDSSAAGAAEPAIEDRHLSAQSSISEQDSHYPDYMDEHHLSLHPPLYPSSSTEVQDRSRTPSDLDLEEGTQNGLQAATGASGSYTSDITSGSQSFLSESTVSRMSESDYTSRSETWAASECTMTGSEFEPDSRIMVETVDQIYSDQQMEDSHQEFEETKQMDTLDRPMSPSEYTLITSHDQDRMMQILDLQPEKPREELSDEEDEEGEDEMERDSLQSESDEVLSDDDQGSERPPSPTEYTLIASQDQDALAEVLGLQQEGRPLEELDVETLDLDTQVMTMRGKEEEDSFSGQQEMMLQTEVETQSSGSSTQAVIQLLDSVDNNTVSNISSDRDFEKDSELQREDLEVAPLEPSAPYMPPSPDLAHSASEEMLYSAFQDDYLSTTVKERDTDRFGGRLTEEGYAKAGVAASFEEMYAAGMAPEAARFPGEVGEVLGAEAMPEGSDLSEHDDDKLSSSSSDAAQLDDVEDKDAEILERSEEKMEETDVEEQFSPLSKGSPSKQVFSFSEALEMDLHTQLQSEQASTTVETVEHVYSHTKVHTEQTVDYSSTVGMESITKQKPLVYATESFEQFEEEITQVSEKSQVMEETALCHVTEQSETLSVTTRDVTSDKTEIQETPESPVLDVETERHEQFVTEERETTCVVPSLAEEDKTEEPDEQLIVKTETDRTEEFTVEEKETDRTEEFIVEEKETVISEKEKEPDRTKEFTIEEKEIVETETEIVETETEIVETETEIVETETERVETETVIVETETDRREEFTAEEKETAIVEKETDRTEEFTIEEKETTIVEAETEIVETETDRREEFTAEEKETAIVEKETDRTEEFTIEEKETTIVEAETEIVETETDRREEFTAEEKETEIVEKETDRTEEFIIEEKETTFVEAETEIVETEIDRTEEFTAEEKESAIVEKETDRTEEFIIEEKETTTAELSSEKTGAGIEPESGADQWEVRKITRLTYMAFDNMGFTEEEASEGGRDEPKLPRQDTREISPEDLEEKPYTFDFPDDYKQELEAQRQYEAAFYPEEWVTGGEQMEEEEMEEEEEEEEEEEIMEAEQESDIVLSYEATTGDSGTYLIEVEEKDVPPDDYDQQSKSVSDQTQQEAEVVESEQPVPADDVDAPADIVESSSESSPDNEIEVFDDTTGAYIKMPWELAHQYKRQFSESYTHQEKSVRVLQQNQSIDLGTFYRREDDASYSSSSSHTEEHRERFIQSRKTKVTFDLSEMTEYKECEEEEEIAREAEAARPDKVPEPHDEIEHTHEKVVISSIQEIRQQVKEDLTKDTDFDAGYLDSDLTAAGATAASHSDMFQSGVEEMPSSYSTAESSLEQAVERKISSEGEEDVSPAKPKPCEPMMSVVSLESRLAQQELLQEMADEKDRSVSPSREELPLDFTAPVDLQGAIAEEPEPESQITMPQVPTTFPMAVHSLGKSLADNEVYESSETERDSTEEKLSPIEEGAGIDDIEDDDAPAKSIPSEKRVTFQTDTLSTPRASEQSTDEFKMSTSSSEMSVEPTLLAASYELDTGRVCHVVSAFDISPDSVEKKLTPNAPTKSILSSPEDDVFETDASLLLRTETAETPTKDESEELTVIKRTSSDFVPSPPTSTPRDGGTLNVHTASDLAQASSVLEHIKTEVVEEDDQETGHTLDESTVHEEDELSSPFEMMSPTELKDTSQMAVDTGFEPMVVSADSATSESDFAQMLSSDAKEDVMTNGPTEVDYVAEYDAEAVKDQRLSSDEDVKEQLEEAIASETEEQEEEESGVIAAVWATEEEKGLSGAEATLSELQLPPGTDINMSMSDQTLYGLEMPSEETVTMSTSLQRDLMAKSETDQDSDQTQPPTEVTFRTDEQVSDQIETSAEMRESALFESDEMTSAEATPVAAVPEQQQVVQDREDEEEGDVAGIESEEQAPELPETHVAEETEDEPYQLDPGSVYPGKRALEIQIPVEIRVDTQEFTEERECEDEPAPEQRLEDEFDLDDDNLLGEAAGGEEEFMEQEAEEMEYMEKPEEELLRLKDSKPESEDEDEDQQQAESVQEVGLLGVQGYDDLERPLSPTPDAFRQMFFGREDGKETESPAQSGAEEDIEKTASHFVESILEDVKEKVQTLSAIQSAEKDQEYEEQVKEEDTEDAAVEEDRKLEPEQTEEELPEDEQQIEDREQLDEVSPMVRSQQTKTTVLMKQLSEDIPGITITEHLGGADTEDQEDEAADETDYPIAPEDFRAPCVPEEEDEDQKKGEATDETDFPVAPGDFHAPCVPEEEDEEQKKVDDVDGPEEELHFIETFEEDTEMQFEMTIEQPESKPGSFLAESDPASAHTFASVGHLPLRDTISSSKVEAGAGSDEEELDIMEADLKMHDYAEPLSPEDHGDSSSVDSFATVVAAEAEDEDEDEGDVEDRLAEIASMSSSMHSDMQLTQADVDDRFEDTEDEDLKIPQEWPKSKESAKEQDFSSSTESDRYDSKDNELSSSVESDRYTGKEELSSSVESDRYGSNVEMSSSVESDRYEFVDRAALSVITELSEEEQFEMIEKDDLGNETGPESDTQEQFHCSPPEGPSQSPGFGSTRYFTKPLQHDRDDASVSSSLLEFERLEKQIGNSGSSSIDTSDKESFGGSYDERKHHMFLVSSYDDKKFEYGSFDEKKLIRYRREMDRDDMSTTSSLAEFEKLERQIDQQGSSSSVEEKFTAESKSSGGKSGSGSGSGSVAGSVSSLAEFEKLEAELAADSDDRRSSVDSSLQRRSETSSLASLNEFESLERDVTANIELEAEAQKIVSYLEAGSLDSGRMFYYSSSVGYSSSDLSEGEGARKEQDRDSLDVVEHDSLSEGEDKDEEPDSLEGDTSEMTEMTSSVIFAGPELAAAPAGASHDMDADSLAGECIMQLSTDSLILTQQMRTSDSSKFDTDSLLEQEDIMVRSVDSLEQEKHSDKCDQDSLQEDIMHTSADSLEFVQVEQQIPENLMLMSVESAHWSMGSSGGTMCRSEESHTDSHDFMQVSAESLEDLKTSHTEQTLKTQVTKSSEYTQEGASIEVMHYSSSSTSTATRTQVSHSFVDDDGNLMESSGYSQDDDDDEDDKEKESPFMSWGPYREQKKVYTMAEWEAMKKEKQRAKEERSGSSSPLSTEAEQPGGDSIDTADISSDDGFQTHRVVMKKEVHKKTVLRPDGQEETIIKEESEVHQDSEPPEELRDSMQQIINQFIEYNPQVPAIAEDDGAEVDEGTEV